jgi:hypothetical protein
MDPKSGKSPRLFNPLSIWTDFALKSGAALLTAAQAAITRPTKPPKVAVIHSADAPSPRARAGRKAKRKSAKSAGKSAASRARRRGR